MILEAGGRPLFVSAALIRVDAVLRVPDMSLPTASFRPLLPFPLALGLAALLLGGCSGDSDPVRDTDPQPAHVAIVSGDAQQGEPGALLGAVTVVVTDAAGNPVADVPVRFAIESGGGSIAAPDTHTDANGFATSGRWTFGAAGPQVLLITAGTLTPIRAHGTAVSAGVSTTLPGSGGTVRFDAPDAVFNGLSVTVPATSYTSATTWTITELPGSRPTLPTQVRQIGPTLRLSNGRGFAQAPFAITVPLRVSADTAVAAFFRDPVSGTMELIPIVARTDSSLVLMTQHVAADQMLLPDPPSSAPGRAGLRAPGGGIEVIVVGGRTIDLRLRINTSFLPGVDDWEFTNYGSYATPGGYCVGSTLSALYHNYSRKSSRGPLWQLYDSLPVINQDNPRGIKLASVVQRSVKWETGTMLSEYLASTASRIGVALGGPAWVKTQMEALALAMVVTGRGQQLAIYQPGLRQGHALVAFAMQWGTLYVADPNQPGATREIQFTDQQFIPFDFSDNARSVQQQYTDVFVVAASAVMPVRTLDGLFAQLESGTIGDGYFEPATAEYRDPVDTVWRPIEDLVVTTSSRLTFRSMCRTCRYGRDTPFDDHGRAVVGLYNAFGGRIGEDLDDNTPGVDFATLEGTNAYGLLTAVVSPDPTDDQYVFDDFSWTNVKTVDFALTLSPANPAPGVPLTFTVQNGGIGNSDAYYRWYFTGADPFDTPWGETSVTRSFTDPIGVTIRVELRDARGVLARSSLTIGVAAWRITSISDQDQLIGGDITGSGPIHDLVEHLLAAPTSGMISVDETDAGSELRLRVRRSGAWSGDDCCPVPPYNPASEMMTVLGVDPEVPQSVGPYFAGWNRDFWTETSENLGDGTMTGQYLNGTMSYTIEDVGTQIGPRGGTRIEAHRVGSSMTGTIEFTIWFIDDESHEVTEPPDRFRFPFTATRIR